MTMSLLSVMAGTLLQCKSTHFNVLMMYSQRIRHILLWKESSHFDQSCTVSSSPQHTTSIEQQRLVFLPLHHQGAEFIMLLDGGTNASIINSHAMARLNLEIVNKHMMGVVG
jgi:hypothetical protein